MSGQGRGARYVVQWHDVQDNSVLYTCACSRRMIDECSRPGPDGVQMNPGCARIWDIYNTLDSGLKACTCMTSEKDYTDHSIYLCTSLYICIPVYMRKLFGSNNLHKEYYVIYLDETKYTS